MGVLVVDDSSFMRMAIKNILQKNNIQVLGEATNGKDSIDKYKKLKPNIITMDITMPELDGIKAIEKIIKIDPEAKIIVCSAMGQEPKVIEAITAGAKSFIVKPINEARLVEEINKLL